MSETFALCLFFLALPFEQFSTGGVTFLKLSGGLAIAVWLIGHLRPHDPVRWDTGLILMTLLVVWGAVSSHWSIDSTRSMEALPTYILLNLSYFLIINVLRKEKQLSWVMTAMWLGSLVLLGSGAVEVAENLRGESYRVAGIFGNPNGYVVMLVACIPAFYWVYSRARFRLHRLITAIAVVIGGITSLYAKSMGGLISIAVFFLVLIAFRKTRGRGLILAALFSVLVLRLAPLGLWERFERTYERGGDQRTLDLWPAGLAAVEQQPLIGHGLGTNASAIASFIEGDKQMAVHNSPLAVAIELGFVGLALYLGFMVYAAVRLLRAYGAAMKRRRSKECMFAAVLFAAFAGYLVAWFKGGGMEYGKMLWVLLGLMSAYSRLLEQSSVQATTKAIMPSVGD